MTACAQIGFVVFAPRVEVMKINYTSGQVWQFVFGDFMRYWVAEKDIFWVIGFLQHYLLRGNGAGAKEIAGYAQSCCGVRNSVT